MAYQASLHTTSNKPYAVAQGVPDGARTYFYDTALFLYRPFQSADEAIGYFDTATKRKGHFTVVICSGLLQSNGTFVGGGITEWWWENGVANGDFVQKYSGGGGGGGGTSVPDDIVYQVQASGSNNNRIVTGNSSATLTAFVGNRIRLLRNNVPLNAGVDYSWTKTTGALSLTVAPNSDEFFLVQAY